MTRTFTCSCGHQESALDVDALVGPVKSHFDHAHPELGITEISVRNYLEAEVRLSSETERLPSTGDLAIVPIEAWRVNDIAEFMDHRAYADNPAWAGCYCMYFFLGGHDNPGWGDRFWRNNRGDILDRVATGRVTGSLAYSGDRVVGWCNATARSQFPGLATGDDDDVASVVCFLIAPPYRGHGVAAQLLRGALGELRRLGYRRAEAYPLAEPASWARAFPGTVSLFTEAGFTVTSNAPLTVWLDL